MNIYRANNQPLVRRWNVSWWKKLYVRIARIFKDVRAPYKYHRELQQYYRNLTRYNQELAKYKNTSNGLVNIRMPRPVHPVPPPISILE